MDRKNHSEQTSADDVSTPELKAAKVIVLAGAGFSAPLDYSTLFDFGSAIATHTPPETTAKERRELEELFQQVRRGLVARGKYTDSEAILWRFSEYLELSNHLRFDNFLNNEFLSTVIDQFRYTSFTKRIGEGQRIVSSVIINHYGPSPQDQETAEKVLKILESLINENGGVLDYFTTNYDVGMECIWKTVASPPPLITGIEKPLELSGKWDGALLDVRLPNREGLYVHRLHGCVRWFRCVSENCSNHDYIIARPDIIEDDEREPCVMYPGRKIYTSQQPFASSFINFRDALSSAACCIIIGTSFRDDNIVEYLIVANDRREDPIPIVVIDRLNMESCFFQKIEEVRNSTYFHYDRTEWRVKFIIGDYTSDYVQKELRRTLNNLGSIKIIDEVNRT
jgi:NAD-dependent SIR2 family protein deacetylase